MHRERRIIPLAEHGAHLITGADGRAVVRMRTGRFAVLGDKPVGLEDALSWTSFTEDERDYLARLTAELEARDSADDHARWPRDRRTIGVLGAGRILDELTGILSLWGVHVIRFDADADPPRAATLVLAYADSAAERSAWHRFDDLPGRGVAWLRAYREGECLLIDPLSLSRADATSEQVSRRRVAASLSPLEVDAWQRSTTAPTAPLDTATCALAVARLLQMLLSWAQSSEALPALRRTLWKFVPATGAVTEHTVLAYPEAPRAVTA